MDVKLSKIPWWPYKYVLQGSMPFEEKYAATIEGVIPYT
jgi:hypothetical protein